MTFLDYLIFGLYMAAVLGVGYYHFRRNKSTEDYFVGGRGMKAHHVGLSVVATDVGGGFSIGLGGVGFVMGLAGTWLLFTGLVGAWLSAVFIIPRIKKLDEKHKMMTYPDFLRHRYGGKVALVAALISGIGYLGFTGAQILAGAKLASGTFVTWAPFNWTPLLFSLLVIAGITLLYTVFGGLKAVIYTDTVQWIVLLFGLIFVTIPIVLIEIGGFGALRAQLPPEYFSLLNIKPVTFINWMVTIIPIWVIAMTLYQRVYACPNVREARKAWFIAGLFEYPVMAFTGVFLGMCARVLLPDAEREMGLPLLIRNFLPIGVTGIVISAYFSAIMSTADSCLMASAGNFTNDIVQRYWFKKAGQKTLIHISQLVTLIVGIAAVALASRFKQVLDAILFAYSFMVSGLLVPTLGAYFWKRGSSAGALAAMIAGGTLTILLQTKVLAMPGPIARTGLDASLFGILLSGAVFLTGSYLLPDRKAAAPDSDGKPQTDRVEQWEGALVQHGPLSDRVYLMSLDTKAPEEIVRRIDELALANAYSKAFGKIPARHGPLFLAAGYRAEATIPGFYNGKEDALFIAKYFAADRAIQREPKQIEAALAKAQEKAAETVPLASDSFDIQMALPADAPGLAEIYAQVFETYPFPVNDPDFLVESMNNHTRYFLARHEGKIVAASSAEMEPEKQAAEMTDFATLPDFRGKSLASSLLQQMETRMKEEGILTAYTIARSVSFGMNITFARAGYQFAGTLANNTQICGKLESMNVWHKSL